MKIPNPAILFVAINLAGVLLSRWRSKRKTSLERVKRFYRDSAVILLNTIILIVAVNVLLLVPILISDSIRKGKPAEGYKPEDAGRWAAWEKVYPGFSREELQTLWNETSSPARSFVYEPYTEFKERPYAGKYLNVDVNGFRLTKGQGPWPPDSRKYFNIFLFGGSTTFGYGVSDDQTVASHLQALLSGLGLIKEVRVYNFGQEAYYSTQERIQFEKMVTAGFRPDVAVFIDGLNDSHHYDDRPSSAKRVEEALEGRPVAGPNVLAKVPMVRAALAVGRWLGVRRNDQPAPRLADAARDKDACSNETVLLNSINRYAENKKVSETVAAAYGVKTLFIWQPVAVYNYDQRYNLFAGDFDPRRACVEGTYPLIAKFARQHPLGDDFFWAADIQENVAEPLYVDPTHYSGRMSELFAQSIVKAMSERSLLPDKGH